ncbi:hypothetical protein Tco_0621764 [Tanacetum coccineum]
MNPIAAQQVALDNALVAPEKRLKIEKCNARIEFSKQQRKETYQVTLDALKFSPCYPTFPITAKDLGYSGKYDMLSAIHTDQMHQSWRMFAAIINSCFTLKEIISVLEEELAEKPKRAKKPAKKSTTMPTAGVVIRDTPGISVSKKKAPTKANRGKGMDLLSEAALLEAAQLKKTLKKSNLETHKIHTSGISDGVGSQPKVPDDDDERNDDDSDDVTKDDDDDADIDADGDNKVSDSEKTNSDEDENPNLNQNDDEEEEYEEEYVCTPDHFEFTDDDEEYEKLYKDTTYEQVKDDEHLILTIVHDIQKTEVLVQSSSISSNFANRFLNLDNVQPTDSEVISMMNFKSTPTPTPAPTTEIATTSIPALLYFSSLFGFDQRFFALEKELSQFKQADYSAQLLKTIKSYTTEFEKKAKDKKKRYIDLIEKSVKEIMKDEVNTQLPHILPKEISDFATPVIQSTITESLENKLERPLTPDPDWNAKKSIDFRPPQTWISKIAKAEKPPLTFDELMSTPIEFSAYVINNLKIDNLTQEHLVGPAFNLLKGTCKSQVELEYHFKEYRGRQVVHVNYFINNDLEYLKGGSLSRKYTTSTTKTKADKYDDIQGIEDMVPSLWSPVKLPVFIVLYQISSRFAVRGAMLKDLICFDSNEEEVVPNVEEVSLVEGVFDGAFGGDGEEEVIMGEGVVVTSS